jgi:Na+-transporting methylmalonyl-CoA/oxaloacetate decarboxylase gamma subunit
MVKVLVSDQRSGEMKPIVFALMAYLALGGCGLGETAVSAAAGATAQAEQAKEALKTEARVKQQLDAAAALAAQQRQAAEASSQ